MRIVTSAFVTLSLALLVIVAVPYDAESGYLGEVCWSLAVGSLPWHMKFGVEDIGGGHLTLVGKTDPFGVMVPVMGNVIIDTANNKVRISYTYWTPLCSSPSCAATQIFESGGMVLDISTLNGTVDFIDTKYNPATGITQSHASGSATFVTCPALF